MKRIRINVEDKERAPFMIDGIRTYLSKNEFPHVYLNQEISDEDFDKALDVIATYFMQREISYVIVDLKKRDYEKSPIKAMTLDDIETALGHRVNIVNMKDNK